MKKLVMAVMVLALASGCMTMPEFRHSLDPDEQLATYIDEHGKSKNDAFVSAHAWIAKNFKSAHDVIQMQDKEAGMIVVKAAYIYYISFGDPIMGTQKVPGTLEYTLSVYLKDQKMKLEFSTGYADSYLPKNQLNLVAYYKRIHDDLVAAVMAKPADF